MTGSGEIINIVDFDVNTGGDILVVGNTSTATDTNAMYSLAKGATLFNLVPVDPQPNKIQEARFYYTSNASQSATIVNANNVGYVSADDPGNELLQFTGFISGVTYPIGGTDNYTILDFSIKDYTDVVSASDVEAWLIAPNPSSQNTGYYQILAGAQFNIPGYVGGRSLVYVTDTTTYTQSSGSCN
jgi:hypothetical protein